MIKYYGEKQKNVPGPVDVFVSDTEKSINEPLKHVERHSPDGFQWSYLGSGPADLALSILHDYFSRKKLDKGMINDCYQNFKSEFIATASDKLEITGEQIESWLNTKKS